MVVMAILALLATIATPLVSGAIRRAREAALHETLVVTRKAIDDYYADAGEYPPDLKTLVDRRYLRSIPLDPIVDRMDAWKLTKAEGKDGPEAGVIDLHSSAEGKSLAGTAYADW